MTQYTQFTAVVPAEYAELYRQSAAAVHPSAEGMFVTPLYSEGVEQPTHYISTGMIDVDFIAAVTIPEDFAAAVDVTLAEAQWFKDNFTYCAVGAATDEESPRTSARSRRCCISGAVNGRHGELAIGLITRQSKQARHGSFSLQLLTPARRPPGFFLPAVFTPCRVGL